jgi:hypothetical protein
MKKVMSHQYENDAADI